MVILVSVQLRCHTTKCYLPPMKMSPPVTVSKALLRFLEGLKASPLFYLRKPEVMVSGPWQDLEGLLKAWLLQP